VIAGVDLFDYLFIYWFVRRITEKDLAKIFTEG